MITQYNNYLVHWRLKGSKNGERRYQNEDGTYTELGAARKRMWYREKHPEAKSASEAREGKSAEDIRRENNERKQRDQWDANYKKDNPSRLDKAEERLRLANDISRNANQIGDQLVNATKQKVSTSDIDISKLSDQELQKIVNRLNLEQNYNRLTTTETVNKGAVIAKEILQTTGSLIGIATGGLLLYKSIKGLS